MLRKCLSLLSLLPGPIKCPEDHDLLLQSLSSLFGARRLPVAPQLSVGSPSPISMQMRRRMRRESACVRVRICGLITGGRLSGKARALSHRIASGTTVLATQLKVTGQISFFLPLLSSATGEREFISTSESHLPADDRFPSVPTSTACKRARGKVQPVGNWAEQRYHEELLFLEPKSALDGRKPSITLSCRSQFSV